MNAHDLALVALTLASTVAGVIALQYAVSLVRKMMHQ